MVPGGQGKRFFFEKRSKKLSLLWHALPERTATAT
jgi:hypothetical protein